MKALPLRLCLAGALIATTSDVVAQTPTYEIIELGTFGTDPSTNSNATGMNELGHVAGLAEDDNGQNHAFLYRDGALINLGGLPGGGGFANGKGVNDLGQVVGQANAPAPGGPGWTGRPFVWTEGQGMVDPEPNDPSYGTWCWGINNSGQLALSLSEAYFWDPVSGATQIELPGAPTGFGSSAWEINNSGEVCGSVRNGSVFLHAFRYDSATDTIEDLHDPVTYAHSEGYGINDNGDIAGWAVRHDNFKHPMVWAADGRTIVLPTGDLTQFHVLSQAEHINNAGTVVGLDISGLAEPPIGWVAYDVLNAPSPVKFDLRSVLSLEDQTHWTRMHPFEVNESGQICGTGTIDGKTRAFLMTPVGPWANLGGGSEGVVGVPSLEGSGSLVGGTASSLTLSQAPSNALMLAWLSFAPEPFTALGGTVHAYPFAAQIFAASDAAGSFTGGTSWPTGIPSGTEVFFQFVIEDLSVAPGLTLSNGVRATTP